MSNLVQLTRRGDIAIVRIDHPPVNVISSEVVSQLGAAIAALRTEADVAAVLIYCNGRTFVAGGDINGFDDPTFSAAPFNKVLAQIEALDVPVVAALHGTVLGGGVELALACHYRICAPETTFGMPEVTLGLLPGSLGTQRLPRLVGIEAALDLISSGRRVNANRALQLGLVDACEGEAPLEAGILFAQSLIERKAGPRRVSGLHVNESALPINFFNDAMDKARRIEHSSPASLKIVEAIQASTLPFTEGGAIESRHFETLRASMQSRALRYLFSARHRALKIPGLAPDRVHRQVNVVGVLGAGTMGTGIAMNFLNAGIDVYLLETSDEALQRGLETIRHNYERSAEKGKLTRDVVDQRMLLLHGTLDDTRLSECDLVIEAVFENMMLKKQVCAHLGKIAKPDAIIATNTSTLNVDEIADSTGRPGDVIGMHFFSPANVMPLLEVVRGAQTRPDVLATVMGLAKRIKKTPVVSGVCYGFIGNRMAEVYMREAEFLIMEGANPRQVDEAVQALGMAMGPCRMLDMAGVDVGAKTLIELEKAGGLVNDPSYRALVRKLFEIGRHGQKTGAGYYRYEGRKPIADPETDQLASDLAHRYGIERRQDISAEEIVERLLYPLINEGAKILEEGIAYRASDIDVVWSAGYGFPTFRGGPMFMADEIGLPTIVDRLDHYAHTRGNCHGYWTVSPLLRDLAQHHQKLSGYSAGQST